MTNLLITLFLSCLSFLLLGQNTNISGIISTYTSVSSISGTAIIVGSSGGFSVGDQLLIIQMQGATIDQSNSGSYAVVVTSNGCSDTSSCIAVDGIGFIENDFGDACILFPNPTDGNFSIDLGDIYPSVKVTVLDLSGKVVLSS
jgi:hypothetical protein